MGSSGEQHPTGKIQRDIFDRGEELLAQLVKESQSLGNIGSVDAELATRRNELLFKLNDQIEHTKEALQQIQQIERRLKKNLNQLESLRHILGD